MRYIVTASNGVSFVSHNLTAALAFQACMKRKGVSSHLSFGI